MKLKAVSVVIKNIYGTSNLILPFDFNVIISAFIKYLNIVFSGVLGP